ncbi:RluA family pseudouridine synthase [Vagococcus vulneris]|uniref:Pseudouridine synthase n=1 Tax=Vagococcus vulneris TaxID=1977869 RepID=A0A429ZUF6_9ENTE|nr:RluA family pseudouridine synthase [Vagococcus vulneris]RST97322.1 RNA pseudouridine synthase [Vagococcus vulneris]
MKKKVYSQKKKKGFEKYPRTNETNNKFRPIEFHVTESGELLDFLRTNLKGHSRNSIKSILTRGQVTVNGKSTTKHNFPLEEGQVVSVQTNHNAMKEHSLSGLHILYEDNDLIVIEKDAGILSVATNDGFEPTAIWQLNQYVKQDNSNNRVFIVHRLDRDTSGVMLFAKSEKVKRLLQDNWKDAVMERMYTALVEGDVKKEKGTIKSWLTESKTFKVHSGPERPEAKFAVTHYKKIRSNDSYSLLEVNLETGRKNQIRVHMEDIGHPIAGDKKYGASSNPIKRLGLHATTISFTHPISKKQMIFRSKVPKSFLKMSK